MPCINNNSDTQFTYWFSCTQLPLLFIPASGWLMAVLHLWMLSPKLGKVRMFVYFVRCVLWLGKPRDSGVPNLIFSDTWTELFKTKKLVLRGKTTTNGIPTFGPTRISSIAAILSQHSYRPQISAVEQPLALHIQIIFSTETPATGKYIVNCYYVSWI
jgi:hypothetical protein